MQRQRFPNAIRVGIAAISLLYAATAWSHAHHQRVPQEEDRLMIIGARARLRVRPHASLFASNLSLPALHEPIPSGPKTMHVDCSSELHHPGNSKRLRTATPQPSAIKQ